MFKVEALCTNIVFCVVTDLSSLREEIRSLRQREQQLLKYKEQSEIEFGQRRAKFKELYLAREGKDIVIRLYLFSVAILGGIEFSTNTEDPFEKCTYKLKLITLS